MDGTLYNIPEFAEAFKCSKKAKVCNFQPIRRGSLLTPITRCVAQSAYGETMPVLVVTLAHSSHNLRASPFLYLALDKLYHIHVFEPQRCPPFHYNRRLHALEGWLHIMHTTAGLPTGSQYALGARYVVSSRSLDGLPDSYRKGLERRLGSIAAIVRSNVRDHGFFANSLVVVILPFEHLNVQRHTRGDGEGLEYVWEHLGG